MTDQENNPARTGDQEQPSTGNDAPSNAQAFDENTPLSAFPPAIQEYVKALRQESRQRKDAAKKAADEARKAEEKRLEEQQEWKKLADARQLELDKLQPIAEQNEVIKAAFNASLDNRLKQIPEDIRKKTVDPIRAALSPIEFSNWLDANMDVLKARQAPPLDGGVGSSGAKPAPQVTPEVQRTIEIARNYGYAIKPEDLAKRTQEIADRRLKQPRRDTDKDKE
jgi:hypothetical protein